MLQSRCLECKNLLSDKATLCPKCGAPNKMFSEVRSRLPLYFIGGIVIFGLIGSLFSEHPQTEITQVSKKPSRPGMAKVYDQIESETDCEKLQAGFNRNANDIESRLEERKRNGYSSDSKIRDVILSYMNSYSLRMDELGCYKN